jgi:hypothetical protein
MQRRTGMKLAHMLPLLATPAALHWQYVWLQLDPQLLL